MTDVRVEPDVLEKASRVCDDLRDEVRAAAGDIGDETEAAVSGLYGWQTRGALEQLRWSCSDDLGKLAGYLEKFGDALRGCAVDYRNTDQANATRFDIRGR